MAQPGDTVMQGGIDFTEPPAPDPVSGKPRRNLHLWLVGAVVALGSPVLLYQALREDRRDHERARQAETQRQHAEVSTPPSAAPLETAMREQRDAAMTQPGGANSTAPPPGRTPPDRGPPASVDRGRAYSPDKGPLGGRAPGPAPEVADPFERSGSKYDVEPETIRRMQIETEEQEQRSAALASPIVALAANNSAAGGATAPGVARAVPAGAERVPVSVGDIAGGQELLRALSSPQPRAPAFDPSGPKGVEELVAAGMARLPPTGAQQNRRWLDDQAGPESSRAPLRPQPLSSPFTLFQGTVLAAVLISEVNSDLPGMLTAQVTQDVYDGVSGDQLLIPKGSRLVGEYNSDVRPGQERVLAAFSRLIYPSGASVSLLGMPSADAQGRAGLEDQVDNHFFRIFGSSFIVAGLAWFAQRHDNPSTVVVVPGTGTSGTLTGAAGQVVDTARTILERDKNIPPTIVIRQGHKFNLMIQRDMVLPPEQTR
jgi:type IV secretory pathway VirB10-like protein